MIDERDEIREELKKYCKPLKTQEQMAKEMGVNKVNLSQFMHKKHGVGGEVFQKRARKWLNKQAIEKVFDG